MSVRLETSEFTHFHLFAGLGGGARGINRAKARLGMREGRFRCIGGIDVDPKAIKNFNRLTGVAGTVMDLFDREQYISFHGNEPPADWREATPDDIRRSAGGEWPNFIFLSAPCKGFSGLLSETTSLTVKYQALNRLTLRGVWLTLEAFRDNLPEIIAFENVPRIATRGRPLLDQIVAVLRHFGYAVAETVHDCGEIGGLAQSRKRFLLVARHMAKVPPFLYEPRKSRLLGVGEVLDRMPLPGHPAGGAMHRVPSLQWKTWVRLAFVEAGSDWRSLNKLNIADGFLKDFGIMPDHQLRSAALGVMPWSEPSGAIIGESFPTNGRFAVADPRALSSREGTGFLGVGEWDQPTGVVTGNGRPGSGAHSIADPRPGQHTDALQGNFYMTPYGEASRAVVGARKSGASAVADPRARHGAEQYGQYGVTEWAETSATVTTQRSPGQGKFSVADPRHMGPAKHSNEFRIVPYDHAVGAISSAHGSGQCVADPRPTERADYKQTKYRVTAMEEAAGVVIAASTTGNGAFAVADPRPVGLGHDDRKVKYDGHYGVAGWQETARTVPANGYVDNGRWSVADPRDGASEFLAGSDIILPSPADRLTCVIRALDGTWHRPFTTLELAALQSLIDVEDPATWAPFATSDSDCREQIGNAVPPYAATGMGDAILQTLLLAQAGETFMLSSTDIWVRPIALALSVDTSQVPA